ncbi:MAG: YidC/Oxa1 family membrane protein insertase [Chloroflexi bacterium]|nr:YidC/Oxa1 family membrane protein insertase [Chloroflexota bacterium]
MLDIIVNPFITILLFLYQILGGNVVLAIIVFTILVRLATYPLTMKQQRSTKAMQEIQPEMKKLQEKYKNDRERLAAAQMELYREYGVNPLAGCLPLLIQFPILIGLYRAIVATLAATPLQLLDLSGRLWIDDLSSAVPMDSRFLWLNLATPDPLYILPILVVVTTWLQQKLLTPATASSSSGDKSTDQAAAMSRQMMMIMPIMFGFFSLSFASGLSIYFIVSNIIGIGQYAMMGKIDLKQTLGLKKGEEPAPAPVSKRAAKAKARAEAEETDLEPASASVAASEPARPKRDKSPDMAPVKGKRSGVYDSRAQRAKAKR